MRIVALEKLAVIQEQHPEWFPEPEAPPDPKKGKQHDGLRKEKEYEYFVFSNFDNWKHNPQKGSYTKIVTRADKQWRITLFKFKTVDRFGWVLKEVGKPEDDPPEFSPGKYADLATAREEAWHRIEAI
jgi:hypothetical protein